MPVSKPWPRSWTDKAHPFFGPPVHRRAWWPRDSVVVIKINGQWVGDGSGSGVRPVGHQHRLDQGAGLAHSQPSGWVCRRGCGGREHPGPRESTSRRRTPANAQDQNQSLADVITVFQGMGRPVSLQDWTALNANLLPGGNLGPEPASCEYSNGNMDDGYVLLNDNTPGVKPINGYSYPKFRTAGGRYVSMRHGLWDGFILSS